SGVAVVPALVHAAKASGDAALTDRVLEARAAVIRGDRLSTAFHATRATTPTVVRLSRAGEEAGRLGEMLHYAAQIEQNQAEAVLQRAIRLLEPMLILAFGGIIAFVAASLLQAIYAIRPGTG
ncbi:MAG TPA: type II secretion system F family protein, partial [Gemmatimonadaceae bacterium]